MADRFEWTMLVVALSIFAFNPGFAKAQEPAAASARFDEDTPVDLDPLASQRAVSGTRAWRAPDYSGQDAALGWSATAFQVPPSLERQVRFWKDIYTTYTTQQGVIHDSEEIDVVYEIVDFRDVEKSLLPARAKEKFKRQMVDDAKRRALASLRRILEIKNPLDLPPAERRLWGSFTGGNVEARIRAAMDPSRLRFQLGQKDRMETALFISGRYLEDFENVFRQNGLPIELTRLVFVESSFNVLARSKVGASGLWQLMPGTSRPFRIMNTAVDGRNHPLTATRTAARILADNFRKLGSWPLALTGYNHGPAGVARLADKYGTRDLGQLVRDVRSSSTFGFASRNFYASFLAALEVEREANRYFPSLTWSKRFEAEEFRLPQAIKYADLLNWFGGDDHRLQLMNPHLTRATRRGHAIPGGTTVLIPSTKFNQALLSLGHRHRGMAAMGGAARAMIPVAEAASATETPAASMTPEAAPATPVAPNDPPTTDALPKAPLAPPEASIAPKIHRVSRGESLTMIAESYRVSLRNLLKANRLALGEKIRPGQKLRIPR